MAKEKEENPAAVDAVQAQADAGAQETKAVAEAAAVIKKVKIKIFNSEGPGGNHAVFVGVNGREYQIPREKEIEVSVDVLHVLNDAVQTVYEKQGEKLVGRDVPRYNVQVIGLEG